MNDHISTARNPLPAPTLGQVIARCGLHYGSRTAVVMGSDRRTSAQFVDGIAHNAGALMSLGLQEGDRVGLLMGDSIGLMETYYGVLWAGLVVVPMNARLGAEDQAYILKDAGAKVLVHDAAFAGRAQEIRGESGVEHVVCIEPDATLDGGRSLADLLKGSEPVQAPSTDPDALAVIPYTGGTTGRPKGVAHSHRTFGLALWSELLDMGIGHDEVFAHVAPMTHSGGLFFLPVWMRGGTNHIMGGFDPGALLQAIESERITATMAVPTMLYTMLDHPDLAKRDTSSIQTLIYGAAPMGRERLEQGIAHFGPVFSQLYGQTEMPNQICVLSKQDHAAAVAEGGRPEILSSCGRAVLMAEVRVAGDDLQEVPLGEVGEIIARGPHCMLGYWNKEEATAETIQDGWLLTGDLARRDGDGYIAIVDRKKDMVVSGGFNVYPKEVEQVLFTHPDVADVCVVGVPDDKWGEAVKACVVLRDGASVEPTELIGYVKERRGSVLAPKSVDVLDAIPLTAVGKHDRLGLKARYWEGRDRMVN